MYICVQIETSAFLQFLDFNVGVYAIRVQLNVYVYIYYNCDRANKHNQCSSNMVQIMKSLMRYSFSHQLPLLHLPIHPRHLSIYIRLRRCTYILYIISNMEYG
jgi:hypothetical protein